MTKRVLILGGGFGGLNAAKALHRFPGEVVVVDRTNHHLFQPLLYQVATAGLSPADIAVPIREVLRKQHNTSVLMGEVVAIDVAQRTVTLAGGDSLPYTSLVVAIGSRHSYFAHPEWEAFAPGLKTLADAIALREHVLASYEWAERLGGGSAATGYLTFAIVGAGPTGVEMAGAIAEIAQQTMVRNFRRFDPRQTKVILIEAGDRVLPAFSPRLGQQAKLALERLGVEVRLGVKVVDADRTGVTLEDQQAQRSTLPTANVIWAAGNEVSDFLATLGVPRDRAGRVVVGADLAIPNHPEVFVIGDAASNLGADGQPLPGVAQVAIQQGLYLGKLLTREATSSGATPANRPAFRYIDRGIMATIGKAKAVARLGASGPELVGLSAWLTWSLVHVLYLIGFRNRFVVFAQWIFWYLSGRRGMRLVHHPLTPPADARVPRG